MRTRISSALSSIIQPRLVAVLVVLICFSPLTGLVSFATPNFCEGLLQVRHSSSELSLGETVTLVHPQLTEPLEVQFLGKTLNLNHTLEHALFFDVKKFEIHTLPYSQLQFQTTTQTRAVFVRSENQVGGTCAAYSMFNCLRQTELNLNAKAPDQLKKAFKDESARIRTLMRATHDYYLKKGGGIDSVFQQLAVDSGVKTFAHPRNTSQQFKDSILLHLSQGHPTLIRFDVSSKMMMTDYTIHDHDQQFSSPKPMDRRLWIPFKSEGLFDFPQGGGHAITLLADFRDTQSRHWILVSDPNWQMPRLWPAEYLDRLNSAKLKAWSLFL